MLVGPLAHHGYDWWWHSFTAQDAVTGEDKPFFIEFFLCNPALGEDVSVPVNLSDSSLSIPLGGIRALLTRHFHTFWTFSGQQYAFFPLKVLAQHYNLSKC